MPNPSWSDTIRSAIIASGKTQAELAKSAGIAQPILCHFLRGSRTISLATAEKIAAVVGIKLQTKKGKQ